MTDQEVMARFESLGENCEFGIAQRMAGIEPFGLFRFAAMPADLLLRLLLARFAGLADDLALWNRDGEWMTKDLTFDWSMHTWTRASEVDHDTMLAREGNGWHIFAIGCSTCWGRRAGRLLWLAAMLTRRLKCSILRTYGPSRLLFVAEGRARPVTLRPGLTYGTIPRFADWRIVDRDTDLAAWLAMSRGPQSICRTCT